MGADTDAVLDAFGKNRQDRKVFWTFFIATAGLVLAQVVDPAAAEKIVVAVRALCRETGRINPALFYRGHIGRITVFRSSVNAIAPLPPNLT